MRLDTQLMASQLGAGLQEQLLKLSMHEYSRGANVLKKYWKEFKGIVISDDWRAYVNMFFPTRDSDALHICSENQKMYPINQKTNWQLHCMKSFQQSCFMQGFIQNCIIKKQRIAYANYLSGQIDSIV